MVASNRKKYIQDIRNYQGQEGATWEEASLLCRLCLCTGEAK